MRTPGHDEELALGFLHGEGLIDGPREAGLTEDFAANIVEVRGPLLRDPGARRFYTTSSCGVCGKGALEEVAVHRARGRRPARASIAGCSRLFPIACASPAFERTGGLHATGLFTADGELLFAREDVGRHNAMDKVIGRALLDGRLPLAGSGPVCQRAACVRAGAEGGRRGRADHRRRRRTELAGDRAGRRPRDDACRVRAQRAGQRLHRGRSRCLNTRAQRLEVWRW